MRNSYFILLILFILLWGCNTPNNKKKASDNPFSGATQLTDSLNWEIQYAENDSLLFTSYTKFFEHFACADQELAQKYLDSMEQISERNNSEILRGRFHLSKADFLDCDQRVEEAELYYIDAVKILKKTEDTESLASAYNNLGYVQNHLGKAKEAVENYHRAFEIREANFDTMGMASTLNNMGYTFDLKGESIKALTYYSESLKLRKAINYAYGIAQSLNNIAFIYQSRGDVPKAVDYFQKAVKYFEDIHDDEGLSVCYNNIGILYQQQKDYENALQHYSMSLNLIELTNDQDAIARTKSNIGFVYLKQKKYELCKKYYFEALKYLRLYGDKLAVAGCLVSIGNSLIEMNDNENPFSYFNEALTIYNLLENKVGLAEVNIGFSSFYASKENYAKAKEYAEMAHKYSIEAGFPENIKTTSFKLYELNKKNNDPANALKHYEMYLEMREKTENLSNQNAVLNSKFQIEYERQSAADSVAAKAEKERVALKYEKEMQEEENKKNLLFGGLGFALLLSGLSIYAYQRKRKDNRIIAKQKIEVETQRDQAKTSQFHAEEQKLIVEEKNREITDSIQYAKRLQNAILPNESLIQNSFKDSFILYRPKAIVAGDFYWFEHLESEKIKYIAVADCTGHGVPGAMVSVVCSTALSKVVVEEGIRKPSEILERVKDIIIKTFEKSNERINDGMDIGICMLVEGQNKMEYSGANIPLIHIKETKNSEEKFELELIKATKMPVGKYKLDRPFVNHIIEFNPNDRFFMYTDGYADQFGGENHNIGKLGGKKLKSSNLRKLLLSIQEREMEEQKEYLHSMFDKWKGSLEQIDDVCIIGWIN